MGVTVSLIALRIMRLSTVPVLVILMIPTVLLAQKSGDAASLSGWGAKGSFQSRAAKTPVFRSTVGSAYAEVSATAIAESDVR